MSTIEAVAVTTVPARPGERVAVVLPVDLHDLLRETREKYIEVALNWSNGSIKDAAKLLGLKRTTLQMMLRRRGPQRAPRDRDARQSRFPFAVGEE